MNCNNVADKAKNVPVHKFPANPLLRKEWTKIVQKTRVNFTEPSPKNASAVICSDHFTEECFEIRSDLRIEIGIQSR